MQPPRWGKRLRFFEGTQRALCRVCFVCFCVAPVIGLLVWIAWSQTSWHHASTKSLWERQLSLAIGFQVHIGHVEMLAPRRYRLKEIEFHHPESDTLIGSISSCDIDMGTGQVAAVAESMQVEVAALSTSVQNVHSRLVCQPKVTRADWQWSIKELTLVQSGAIVERFRVDGTSAFKDDRSVGRFALLNPTSRKVIDVQIERWHRLDDPVSQISFQSDEVSISPTIIAALFPRMERLGPDVEFAGTIDWLQNSQTWNLKLTGKLSHISLNAVTDALNCHGLGRGDLDVEQALIANGQLLHARGSFQATDGKINRDWLCRAQNRLQLWIAPRVVQAAVAMIPFEEMSFRFQLDHNGLILLGEVPAAASNQAPSLLADEFDGLAYTRDPIPIVSIRELKSWILEGDRKENSSSVQPASHDDSTQLSQVIVDDWLSRVLPSEFANSSHAATASNGSSLPR